MQAPSPNTGVVAKSRRTRTQSWRGAADVDAISVQAEATEQAEVEVRERQWASRRARVGGGFDSREAGSIAPS